MLKNVIWNVLGQLLPLLAAIICIPILISSLGVERFGLLSLIWIVIGYFSLFDFGIGKAVTKLVAERRDTDLAEEIPGIVASSLLVLLLLGLLITTLGIFFSPSIGASITDPSSAYQWETQRALSLLFLATPVVILSATLRGVAEAYQRFDLTNKIRIPTGILNFVAPAGSVLAGHDSLVVIVIFLALVRLSAFVLFVCVVWKLVPRFYRLQEVEVALVAPLLSFGGWISLSSIISPIMVYGDRFLIASMLSATAVTYYATPYDLMTRLWFIPVALAGVLFPTFSAISVGSVEQINTLFSKAVKYIFALMYVITFICIANAELGLTLWLGADFASQSVTILQVIALGVLINSVAQIPFSLIQASGRPDITAKLHLAELPLYLLALILLIPHTGITGVALIWLARILIDTVALFLIAHAKFGIRWSARNTSLLLIPLIVLYLPSLFVDNMLIRMGYSVGISVLFTVALWFWYTSPSDKLHTHSFIRSLF